MKKVDEMVIEKNYRGVFRRGKTDRFESKVWGGEEFGLPLGEHANETGCESDHPSVAPRVSFDAGGIGQVAYG